MKRIFLILIFFTAGKMFAQEIAIVTFKEFSSRLNPTSDTVHVINFWATWCKPCVDELPEFQRAHETFKNEKFKLTLASLDFKSQYDKKLVPFVKKNNIKGEVLLLNAPDYNDWLPKVNKDWGGSIPATMIIHQPTNTRLFFERQMTYEELETIIKPLLK